MRAVAVITELFVLSIIDEDEIESVICPSH